ncbi:hypothetical protein BKA70DRAFT_1312916 [Coprinopsis sp. MPI-PUGE-AT-0042]|nr:hypothetical protein BKA70DRAFT_1312916 [Coprinopsis sp. MPI-PUGE-AT-0042]
MASKRPRPADNEDGDVLVIANSDDEDALSDVEDDEARVVKRPRHASHPTTPHHPKSHQRIWASITPENNKPSFTPLPPKAFDSPTNPFSRIHTQSQIRRLPQPTSFKYHLPLRFQFFRKDVRDLDGDVFRVVQVPLSFTFTHVRCLVAFLFGSRIKEGREGKGRGEEDHLFELRKDIQPPKIPEPDSDEEEETEEEEKGVQGSEAGRVRGGRVWAKLSTTRDPCRWRAGKEEMEDDDDEDDEELQEEDDENEPWMWKDEDETTLGHAWPHGMDITRGIIYIHSRTTRIHITINTSSLPRRRGKGNTPYVFAAQGRVHLSLPPLPKLSFTAVPRRRTRSLTRDEEAAALRALPTATRTKSKTPAPTEDADPEDAEQDEEEEEVDELQDDDEEGEEPPEFDENHPFNQVSSTQSHKPKKVFVDSDDELEYVQRKRQEQQDALEYDTDPLNDEESDEWDEDPSIPIDPRRWNLPPTAFERFLRAYMGPAPPTVSCSFDDSDDEILPGEEDGFVSQSEGEMPTPGLTPDDGEGEYTSSPLPPTSSPARSSSPGFAIGYGSSPFRGRGISIGSPSASRSSSTGAHSERSFIIPNARFKHTPAPHKVVKVQRMRIERVERQFEKSKKKGLRKLEKEERKEEEEVEEQKRVMEEQRRRREMEEDGEEWDGDGEEVDELDEDEDEWRGEVEMSILNGLGRDEEI